MPPADRRTGAQTGDFSNGTSGEITLGSYTYFNWKKRFGGLLPDEMRRLKALEDENHRLKKIVADLTLDREMLQDVIRRKL